MRVRVVASMVVLGTALQSQAPAYADFVLANAKLLNAPVAPTSATPLLPDVMADAAEQTVPWFKTARGFGDAVRMAFAVRQIVPAGVRVRYGAGIDPETLVSWKGDRPWNQALAAAVHPLRLRIVTGVDSVLITR